MLSEYLSIGQVLKPQGVQGQVKVRPDTDDPARLEALDTVYLRQDDAYLPCAMTGARVRGGFLFCALGEDSTREDAEKRRDLTLYIDRAHAAPLDEGSDYISDLIGCRLLDRQGGELGVLQNVLQYPANDVYQVRTPRGVMYLPVLKFVVLETRPREGIILIDESRLPEVAVHAD